MTAAVPARASLRVLVVDDSQVFREAVQRLLVAAGHRVVGSAGSGEEGLRQMARVRPDLVLLDIQLPEMDGLAVAAVLAELPDPPRVILISSRAAGTYGRQLAGVPAAGFLAKHELSPQSLAALLA